MGTAIDDAIAQATANAAAMANTPLTPAMTGQTSNAVDAPAPARSGPLGLDDMTGGALDVKAWLKVDKAGIYIGADRTVFEELKVSIDMAAIQYCYSVRYGNPAQYDKTYDRVSDVKGRPWLDVLRHAQSIDPKASEFRSADVPFVSMEDVKNKKGDITLVEVGDVMGHSIAVTGFKFFQKFISQVKRQGIDPYNAVINCTIAQEFQKNDKGEWGVLVFKDITEEV